jgi:hypothetical protein
MYLQKVIRKSLFFCHLKGHNGYEDPDQNTKGSGTLVGTTSFFQYLIWLYLRYAGAYVVHKGAPAERILIIMEVRIIFNTEQTKIKFDVRE